MYTWTSRESDSTSLLFWLRGKKTRVGCLLITLYGCNRERKSPSQVNLLVVSSSYFFWSHTLLQAVQQSSSRHQIQQSVNRFISFFFLLSPIPLFSFTSLFMYDALFIQQKHYDMCLRCVPFPVFVMSLLTHSSQHWYVCSWQVKKLAGEVIKRIVSSPPSRHQPSRRSKDVWKIGREKFQKKMVYSLSRFVCSTLAICIWG